MIVCLYGRPVAPFVEPIVRDISAAGARLDGEIRPLTIEDACRVAHGFLSVTHLYVLPFDPPPSHAGIPVPDLLTRIFPNAQPFVAPGTHELCWNKIATQERLLERGLPIPETMVTSAVDDVLEFVRQHKYAVLKENRSCGGAGHIVVWIENGVLVGDYGSHRCVIELTETRGARKLDGERLRYPAPFYLQRLIGDVGPRGVTPPQVLRAYVVDREIACWTERFRERYTRPADWIINHALGARYRFVQNVSDEAKKLALRAADGVGARVCAVDLVRTARGGTYVLEVDTDGVHMFIDRGFKHIPEYRDFFDFDRHIAEALLKEAEPPAPPNRF